MRSRTCVGTTDVSQLVKKQHRQNEPAGQVDVSTTLDRMIGDRHMH